MYAQMNILINCTGLKKGGGLQVGDSICCGLNQFPGYNFTVVLPLSYMHETYDRIKNNTSLNIIRYDFSKRNIRTLLTGRDKFLDTIVEKNNIDGVLTVFGPSLWSPKCVHLSGFARAHLVLKGSPYFTRMSKIELMKNELMNMILKYSFDKSSEIYYTENSYISEKFKQLFPRKKIYTVTNYYNQVFDNPAEWLQYSLPKFDGVTLLTVNAPYPHKNMGITVEIARILREQHPDFNFRFVMTVLEKDLPSIPVSLRSNFELIGSVDICACPSLYKQSDICFQPTLLECFTATYAEAMRMDVPIITTDLGFARGLCSDAAEYYSALSPQSAADVIYKVSVDDSYRKKLIINGKNRLSVFDSYGERLSKLLDILSNEINNRKE